MQLTRLDDYQSWMLTHGSTTVLIDPWLTSSVLTGGFNRDHTTSFTPFASLPPVTSVVLCTDVADHCRPDTLALLDPSTPVHGTPKAARAARRVGMSSTHAHRPGDSFVVGEGSDQLSFRVHRTGFPLSVVAVAYEIRASSGSSIFIDPHLPSARRLRGKVTAETFVAPVKGVVAGPLPATAGPGRVARAARALGSTKLVPTALDPRRDWNAWQKCVFGVWGGVDSMRRRIGDGCALVPVEQSTVDCG